MKNITGEGIILRQTLYGDADSIFEVFSLESGLISILAKGVRKQNAKNVGIMRLFSHIEYEVMSFSPEKNLFRLKRSRAITPFLDESLESQTICALLSEISLAFLTPDNPIEGIYMLWKEFLEKQVFTKKIALSFAIHFFSRLGVFPDFSHASDCQTRFTGTEKIFWESDKGLFLSSQGLVNYKYLPFPLLKVFLFASKTPLLALEKVCFSGTQEKEIWEIFWWFYGNHTRFFPRSKKIFEEIF
jgi:DNA repair protein RecO